MARTKATARTMAAPKKTAKKVAVKKIVKPQAPAKVSKAAFKLRIKKIMEKEIREILHDRKAADADAFIKVHQKEIKVATDDMFEMYYGDGSDFDIENAGWHRQFLLTEIPEEDIIDLVGVKTVVAKKKPAPSKIYSTIDDFPKASEIPTGTPPKRAPKKKAAKKPAAKKTTKKAAAKKVPKKGAKVYMLFDASQFGNSDDAAYELDYAFRGLYLTKEAALKAFATTMVEIDNNLEEDFFDGDSLAPNVKELLEKYNWKILSDELPLK